MSKTKVDDKKPDEVVDPLKTGTDDTGGKDVALRQTGSSLATVDFGDDAGAGLEDMSREEQIIPFIRILQTNSPQVWDEDAKTGTPGVKAGMFFNTATGETYDGGTKGLLFVPVSRDHNFVEFTPRNLGGGFVGVRSEDDPLVLELRAAQGQFGKLANGTTKRDNEGQPLDGTEITESYYLYGLLLEENEPQIEGETFAYDTALASRVMLGFTSTQIKKYKGWVSRMDNFKYLGGDGKAKKPPMWAHVWRMTTTPEQNKKGKFRGWVISLAGKKPDGAEDSPIKSLIKLSNPIYAMGREFYDLIKGGKAKVDYAKVGGDEPEETDEIPM